MANADDTIKFVKFGGGIVSLDLEEAMSLIEEIERLRTLLSQAANDIEDWGAYASEYFQYKHDLAGNVERYRGYLAGNTATAQEHDK